LDFTTEGHMRTRLVVAAGALLALAAPSLASAQIPTGIRPRAVEVGGIGRYTLFPDEVQTDNVLAGGGRLGFYLFRNFSIEGEVSFGVTKADTTAPFRDDTEDVSHTLWDVRFLYNTPQRGRTSLHLGAGYGYDGFGRLRVQGVGPRGHGPTGLVGLRFFVTPRVTLRGDVGGLYVIDDQEPRDQSNSNNDNAQIDATPRFEPSVRLGLGILFRNQPTTSVIATTRIDTVRVTQVDTVFRDRMDAAVAGGGAGAGAGAGAGMGGAAATIVIGVVNFDFDRAEVSSDARRILDDIATSMARPEAGRLRLILTGNTDALGGESYNNRLSERRAEAVRDYLATRGITADRIATRAAGEQNPVASNDNPEGRATNRRVLIELDNSTR
jgi:OOP family OmpA-OmpF porin